MKTMAYRLTALLLVFSLLVPLVASASQVTEDGHVITYPERLEAFVFPGDWSDKALQFCVGSGIMSGRGNDLASKENTTRAETAALIVRLLKATSENPDLSEYTDAIPDTWYYREVAAAVELGIMSGVSKTALAPNALITREQVFVFLYRAFGLYPEDKNAYRRFTDSSSIPDYARDAVSALAERGIVNGMPDGSVRPKQYITRGEVAQLLYKLFTCVCDAPEDLQNNGSVLYRGSASVPEDYFLDGNLIIGCGFAGEQEIRNLTVTGTLTLRPQQESAVHFTGGSVGQLLVVAGMTVSGEAEVAEMIVRGKGSILDLSAETTRAFVDCTVSADQKVLICEGDNMTLILDANVETCVINGKNITILGSGKVGTLEVNAPGSDVQVECENRVEDPELNPEYALELVQTLEVWDVVIEDTVLYSNSNLTGRLRNLPAGTKLDHFYYYADQGLVQAYTEDGVLGWVDADCVEIPTEVELAEPYSTEMMEAFVNQKGYSSSTKYLIWVSLKTQTVNVFQGSKGNWTLIRTMPCASGRNETPTIRGEFYTKVYYWEWEFARYKVKYATTFHGNYAFHSRIWSKDYQVLLDDTIGWPVSDGCVRMLDEDCEYIFKNMPYGTRVVVY